MKKQIFTDEEISSFVELGEILRKIRARLLSEGYVIKDGKITKPELKTDLQSPVKELE